MPVSLCAQAYVTTAGSTDTALRKMDVIKIGPSETLSILTKVTNKNINATAQLKRVTTTVQKPVAAATFDLKEVSQSF